MCCDGAKFPQSIKSARYQLVGVAAQGNVGVLIQEVRSSAAVGPTFENSFYLATTAIIVPAGIVAKLSLSTRYQTQV